MDLVDGPVAEPPFSLIICPAIMRFEKGQEKRERYAEGNDQDCPISIEPLVDFVGFLHLISLRPSHSGSFSLRSFSKERPRLVLL